MPRLTRLATVARPALAPLRTLAWTGLGVLNDLMPGLRMTRRRRLPASMWAGVLGAEVATWAALSPSLLPRPWWVTAANIAIGQTAGHSAATAVAYGVGKLSRPERVHSVRLRAHVHQDLPVALRTGIQWTMAAITVAAWIRSVDNQRQQAALVGRLAQRGPAAAIIGTAVGTAGYGAALVIGELIQLSVSQLSRHTRHWLPQHWRGLSGPLAVGTVAGVLFIASDRVVMRRLLRTLSQRAADMNRLVNPQAPMPWEPERSGSPWSYERWSAVGREGRAMLSSGPRARDIAAIMNSTPAEATLAVREPIRIYIGVIPGRSPRMAAQLAVAEMERTGAFRRQTVVIQLPAGSGWVSRWAAASYEFLTRGDCATVTVQYSYLPSVLSYIVDPQASVAAARELIEAVRAHLDRLPSDDRPKLYFSGESLGAFAITENYATAEELLAQCDGAVFTGPPRMSTFFRSMRRDLGSLERLPVIDGGKHIRFVARPRHTQHDGFGRPYPQQWVRPRVVVAQHASDPIVWWDFQLAYRRPAWIREATPPHLDLDTFPRLPWVPFITFWQVGLDQLNSLNVPGGHGHNYFEEVLWYWAEVLGSQSQRELTTELASHIARFSNGRS